MYTQMSSNEKAILFSAKTKLSHQASGNFDPRINDIYILPKKRQDENVRKNIPANKESSRISYSNPALFIVGMRESCYGENLFKFTFLQD